MLLTCGAPVMSPQYTVMVTGSQTDFDDFFPGGIGLIYPYENITKVDCKYFFYGYISTTAQIIMN